MEINPATFDQVVAGKGGKMVEISDDVQGIALALNEIDSHIRLRFSERGGYFVVYWTTVPGRVEEEEGDHDTYLIFTAQDLDARIIHKMREIHKRCLEPSYSFAKELEDVEAKNKAEIEHGRQQKDGEHHERLAHALRAQAGYDKRKFFVKEGV